MLLLSKYNMNKLLIIIESNKNNTNISPKYIAAKKALEAARDLSTRSKKDLECSLTEMEQASSMPVKFLKTHIWDIYKENEPKRVQSCIDTALNSARGNSTIDKYSMRDWLKFAQEHSELPIAQSVINHVYQEYKKHEPQRKYQALKTALNSARDNTINDEGSMRDWLEFAQEHSELPIAQSIINHVYQEYKKHEPQRKYQALKTALNSASDNSINDEGSMKSWLGYAQEHSHGWMDKALTCFTGLLIKGRYALKPILNK